MLCGASPTDTWAPVAQRSAEQAGLALSAFLGRRFQVSVEDIKTGPLRGMDEAFGRPDDVSVYILTPVTGDIAGHFVLLLAPESATALAELLTGQGVSPCDLELDMLSRSALEEMANILFSVFLNNLAAHLSLRCRPSIPYFSQDLMGAVLSAVAAEAANTCDEFLYFHTGLCCRGCAVRAGLAVLLYPDEHRIQKDGDHAD